jgi:sec-independent protein translocase protein TatA
MPNIGPLEIIVVLVIVLIIFGPKRLPDLGRSLGRGMREFKDSVTGKDKGDDEDRPELSKAEAAGDEPASEADKVPAKPSADAQ